MVNDMAADVLSMKRVRASTTMGFIHPSMNFSILAAEWLTIPAMAWYQVTILKFPSLLRIVDQSVSKTKFTIEKKSIKSLLALFSLTLYRMSLQATYMSITLNEASISLPLIREWQLYLDRTFACLYSGFIKHTIIITTGTSGLLIEVEWRINASVS